ncbi:sigma-70 family RNA polymerase sigma factor [Sphingobium sufflavum]|uniref:sigma-70 family RNA polymerase sigma factor n=1 Tax=Sphingobium sufflavum TaxID=1129547 RepID=UPI001F46D753|nr:sigma-70 family RNA polymerase sigma factor [Sphingobium sufflavum]MCE7798597.1 sigma-70 family RNA polymerase sigma factor [Sphingobium sufflavum]
MASDTVPDRFEAQRPRLLRLAYRMLGGFAEAEDVVQDAWLRWTRVAEKGEPVDSAAAYLTRIVTRLCLDRAKSAQVRRETYVGEWLPEPFVEAEPEAMRADELTLTLMLALERLSPLERAAFLLHDIFDMPLAEVADMLGREPAAVRQLTARARRHVRDARPRYPMEETEAERIASAFFAASQQGDTTALRAMLAENVAIHSDGGGKVIAFRNPIHGIEKALRLFLGLKRKYGASQPQTLHPMRIDRLAGFASLVEGRLLQTTALEIEDGRIAAIYIMRNPDKLARVAAALGAPGTVN